MIWFGFTKIQFIIGGYFNLTDRISYDNNTRKWIKVLKVILLVFFLTAMILLAVYPVKDQDVTVMIDMYGCTVSARFSADEIKESEQLCMDLSDHSDQGIREIRIYRIFKSVCVEKIPSGSLQEYAVINDNKITFNGKAGDMLRRISESFFAERLILAEILLALVMFLWILVNAFGERFDPNIRNNHSPIYEIKRFMKDIKKYGPFMVYAANADLKAEVANSYLNRLWWLLEPFFNMLVYVIVFGKVMGSSVENYATFVFSGLLMWNFFHKTINYSVKCVRSNRDIVTKVYVPKHVLLISNMILNFFKLLFSLIVLIPMLLIFHVRIGWCVFWLLPAYGVMILVSFGLGMFFLHYGVYIDDLGYAVGILLQMMMFLSGVFYDVITGLSVPLNVMMLVLNPVSMFVDTMRNALLGNVMANVPLIGIWTVLSLLLGYMGVHVVYKSENGYVKVV